jgi:hypothetical protein
MEILILYFKLISASLIGMAFQLYFKNLSQAELAQKANLEYSFLDFLKKDKKSIIGTFLTMSFAFLLLGSAINSTVANTPDTPEPLLWGWLIISRKVVVTGGIVLFFTTLAYMGQDAALRVLGRTSKELRGAIDYKTTQADTANGTTEKPTPVK